MGTKLLVALVAASAVGLASLLGPVNTINNGPPQEELVTKVKVYPVNRASPIDSIFSAIHGPYVNVYTRLLNPKEVYGTDGQFGVLHSGHQEQFPVSEGNAIVTQPQIRRSLWAVLSDKLNFPPTIGSYHNENVSFWRTPEDYYKSKLSHTN